MPETWVQLLNLPPSEPISPGSFPSLGRMGSQYIRDSKCMAQGDRYFRAVLQARVTK